MKINSSTTPPQLSVSQQTRESLTAQQLVAPPKPGTDDQLEISDEARTRARKGLATRHLAHLDDHAQQKLLNFLSDLVRVLSGRDVDDFAFQPDDLEAEQSPDPAQMAAPTGLPVAGAFQQTTMSLVQQSFSFSGAIKTADGRELAFSLDLQLTQASFSSQSLTFQNGIQGSSFTYAGTSAELTSTSFSFSLAASDTDPSRSQGIGRFNLGSELAEIGKLIAGRG